jgi:hypothetical protein
MEKSAPSAAAIVAIEEEEASDEEEEPHVEEEAQLSCGEIISQALDDESTEDDFAPFGRTAIPHSDKEIQTAVDRPDGPTRAQKKDRIRQLETENEAITAQIRELIRRSPPPSPGTTADGGFADREGAESHRSEVTVQRKAVSSHSNSTSVGSSSKAITALLPQFKRTIDLMEALVRENLDLRRRLKRDRRGQPRTPDRDIPLKFESMSRSHIEKVVLRSLRGPRTSEAGHVDSNEAGFVRQWVTAGVDAPLARFQIVRSANYREFLAKEAGVRNLELAMLMTDNVMDPFENGLRLPLLLFKEGRRRMKAFRTAVVIVAVDFGKQMVVREGKAPPSIPAQKRLRERGFQSLKYLVNGIEHFVLLDTTRAIPVYGVTLDFA